MEDLRDATSPTRIREPGRRRPGTTLATLLVASAAILVAAILVGLRLPPRGSVAFITAVLLLGQAMIVTTVGFAGLVLRSLQGTTLLALALAWLAAAVVVPILVHAGPLHARERAGGAARRVRPVLREPAVLISLVLVLAMLAWRTVLVLRLPVVDYDGFSYHLVFVDVWLQHDALVQVPQRPWTAGYPAATELLTTWMAAFTRTDALTGFTALLPIPLAIAATTGLARTLGVSPRFALLAGLLLGMTPALVAQAGTTYVDTASAAVVITTWWIGLRVVRGERDWASALLLGVAGGLALGSKGTNVLLVAPVLVAAGLAFIVAAVRGRPGSRRLVHLAGYLALLCLPVLVLGASWYLKNVAVYGNPLYPFTVGPFAGVTTLSKFAFVPPELEGKGLLSQLLSSWLHDWQLQRYAYNVRPGGLGRAWPLVLLLAVGGVAVLARRRRFDVLGLVVLPAAVTLFTMPMPWYARLTLFLPGVALPLAALALDGIAVRRPRLASATAVVVVGVAAISLMWANARPNIDVSAAFGGVTRPPGPIGYLGYVFDPSEDRRLQVSLRAQCAGFAAIPAGARVLPAGFNLLHGVAGPGMDRILTDPPASVADAGALAASADAVGAGWIVTATGSGDNRIAASAPDRFEPHGETCDGGSLWKVLPGGGS
jgi:hypothetical protein